MLLSARAPSALRPAAPACRQAPARPAVAAAAAPKEVKRKRGETERAGSDHTRRESESEKRCFLHGPARPEQASAC